MKKFIILTAVAILVGVVLLRLLQHDPGYVLIVAWGKTVEMRLGFALVLLLVFGVLLAMCIGVVRRMASWVRATATHTAKRREHRLNRTAEQGLYYLLQEDAKSGEKQFLKAAKLAQSDAWHYLAAGKCAIAAGDLDTAEQALGKSRALESGDALTQALLEAEIAFHRQQWQLCLQCLNRAKTLAPKSPVVLKRLLAVYEHMGDWHALDTLLPEVARAKVFTPEQYQEVTERIAFTRLGLLGQQLEAMPEAERPSMAAEVQSYWQSLPSATVQSHRFLERYVHLLILLKNPQQAEAVIRQALKTDWHSPLVALYGALPEVDPRNQLHVAEHWEQKHADDPVLQLTLGRICIRNQLWGQARDHFKRSLALQPTPEAYAELARLLSHLGENENSLEAYKQGLLQSAGQSR